MKVRVVLVVFLFLIGLSSICTAQLVQAPPSLPPDPRLKTDIMVIVAHPDDDTLLIGYLARAVYDQHKRVSVVYTTRGNQGGNEVGYEQAASLGFVREMEARHALASFGISYVWFLAGSDTPSHNPLFSFENWSYGTTLEQVTRLIRLTRPDVILTFLPDCVVGENHGDHQAAGILATEAFDLSGDPLAFPQQVTPPTNHARIGNHTEGLHPWQPEKLYYVTDASHLDFTHGQGPVYKTTDISPSQHIPYYKMVANENSFYLTQPEGLPAKRSLAKGDFQNYQQPVNFIYGKSLVKCSKTGDIFDGVVPGPIPFAPVRGYRPLVRRGISLELGSPWAFYQRFWRAHDIIHLAKLLAPEEGLVGGRRLQVPLLLHNDTDQQMDITVTASLPRGWREIKGTARYPVKAHETYPIETGYASPIVQADQWQTLNWEANVNDRVVGSTALRVFIARRGISLSPAGVPSP